MKAELAEYAARPRASLRSPSVGRPYTPMVEPEIEPEAKGDSVVVPEQSEVTPGNRARNGRWPKPCWAPRVRPDGDPAAKQEPKTTPLAATDEFRAAFPDFVPVTFTPGRRDPFY